VCSKTVQGYIISIDSYLILSAERFYVWTLPVTRYLFIHVYNYVNVSNNKVLRVLRHSVISLSWILYK